MCFEGGFPLAHESPVSVDPGVGSFDNPASRLDFKSGLVFGSGHDVDIDAGCGGEFAGRWAGVTLVGPDFLQVWAVFAGCDDQTRCCRSGRMGNGCGEGDSHSRCVAPGTDTRSWLNQIVRAL